MDQTAGPSILRSAPPEKSGGQNKRDFGLILKQHKFKIIIAVILIILVGVFAFRGSLLSSRSGGGFNLLAPRVNGLTDAALSLVPDKASYKAGEQVIIDVKLYTGGYTTDSTDIVVKYDPAFLAPDEEGFALSGDIYSEYPAMQVDKEQGLIGVSGFTVPGSSAGFNTVGYFATLYFTAVKDGQTQVSVEFVKDATDESNVVLAGSTTDILGLVENADILVSGTDAQAPETNDQSCQSFTQACVDASGNSGTQVCSGGSTKNGSCSYDSEFTESCEVCQTQ